MKTYQGQRTEERTQVWVYDKDHEDGGYPLDPRVDLRAHSPSGFEWGYNGSGPAQLALALLADATGDDELAQGYYQAFKRQVVALWCRDTWEVTQAQILRWVERPGTIPG